MSEEPPTKKIRLDAPDTPSGGLDKDRDTLKEIRSGITTFVNPNTPGFSGVLKQRFSDFLVNEIAPSGEVLHLTEIANPGGNRNKNPQPSNHKTEEGAVPKIENGAAPKEEAVVEPKPKEEVKKEEIVEDVSEEHRTELISIFGESTTTSIESLFKAIQQHPERKRKDFKDVVSEAIEDKEARTKAHQTLRRTFSSRLDSSTSNDNTISISRGTPPSKKPEKRDAGKGRAKGRLGWDELGGEYLHFSLYKENKDTMEIIYYMASQMKMHTKNFAFAGTKDRRAVSVQRISAHRVQADRLAHIGRNLRGARLGNFKYEKTPLTLGQLQGNEFVITLRDCHVPGEEGLSIEEKLSLTKTVLDAAGDSLQTHGFINYYGLQRFGSFSTSTDKIGIKLLQEDLEGAIKLILFYTPEILAAAQSEEQSTKIASDDRNRALALHEWETNRDSRKAIELMPRKFSAETALIRHLGKKSVERDFQGAFMGIQRNLRLMYVHAYQSYVWNIVAGERWKRFKTQVVEGDLVIVDKTTEDVEEKGVDESGELVINMSAEDRITEEDHFTRARPLTKEEAESGSFSIWDVVLPLPGFDVEYPANEIGRFYTEFMGSEEGGGLDPTNMRRKWKDISLSGGYRKLLAKPAHVSWEVKSYVSEKEQLAETDVDRIIKTNPELEQFLRPNDQTMVDVEGLEKIAVVLSMQLGSSQYATIALRELMKEGGLKSYLAEFNKDR